MTEYEKFLKSKVVIAEKFGIDTSEIKFADTLFEHQKDIVKFCLDGGRRAIFASFGLGKTFMQLEIAKQLIQRFNKPFLIVCPLGVSIELNPEYFMGGIYYIKIMEHKIKAPTLFDLIEA